MFVIIKNIPLTAQISDLKNIITTTIANGFFHESGYLKAVKIIQLVDRKKQEVDRYAIVRVDSDNTQKYLISTLNGKTIDGRTIVVNEYFVRHWTNDRRIAKCDTSLPINNRRKADRRRRHLKMVVVCELCETIKLQTSKMLSLTRNWRSLLPF